MAQSWTRPHLTNKVRNKEKMNKCMYDLYGTDRRRKANTITTELRRILPNAVVRYCIKIKKQPCLKEWPPVNHPLLKSSFIDDRKPC